MLAFLCNKLCVLLNAYSSDQMLAEMSTWAKDTVFNDSRSSVTQKNQDFVLTHYFGFF